MLLPSLLLFKSFRLMVFQRSWWSLLLLAPCCFWAFLQLFFTFPAVAGVPAVAGDPAVAVALFLL
jgi:hypothetical protein